MFSNVDMIYVDNGQHEATRTPPRLGVSLMASTRLPSSESVDA